MKVPVQGRDGRVVRRMVQDMNQKEKVINPWYIQSLGPRASISFRSGINRYLCTIIAISMRRMPVVGSSRR
jgi:hypothetical protein